MTTLWPARLRNLIFIAALTSVLSVRFGSCTQLWKNNGTGVIWSFWNWKPRHFAQSWSDPLLPSRHWLLEAPLQYMHTSSIRWSWSCPTRWLQRSWWWDCRTQSPDHEKKHLADLYFWKQGAKELKIKSTYLLIVWREAPDTPDGKLFHFWHGPVISTSTTP